jgi:hypothetical protein
VTAAAAAAGERGEGRGGPERSTRVKLSDGPLLSSGLNIVFVLFLSDWQCVKRALTALGLNPRARLVRAE